MRWLREIYPWSKTNWKVPIVLWSRVGMGGGFDGRWGSALGREGTTGVGTLKLEGAWALGNTRANSNAHREEELRERKEEHASAKAFRFKQFWSFKNGVTIACQFVIHALQGMWELLNDSWNPVSVLKLSVQEFQNLNAG